MIRDVVTEPQTLSVPPLTILLLGGMGQSEGDGASANMLLLVLALGGGLGK